jgi:hypothetical protein
VTLPPGFLDRLRARVTLSDIITPSVKWDARKSNFEKGDFWAPCPFHEEKSASFHVDNRKGFYYCFGCHAKGDAISFLRETKNIAFIDAVKRLSFLADMDVELQQALNPPLPSPTILQTKDVIVQEFTKENFLELGVLTGWGNYIQRHDRLLRSLSFGDPDYAGNVLELLVAMENRGDGSLQKAETYISQAFGNSVATTVQVAQFKNVQDIIGYRYEAPRENVIGVMMPFGGFSEVYDAIKTACETTSLSAKRADEMWGHSMFMRDIMELVNHSAVVVCDLTGRNPNVFYEMGLAHAWGRPVIPITQNKDDVPSDLQAHRYLTYLNNEQGRKVLSTQLAERLATILG